MYHIQRRSNISEGCAFGYPKAAPLAGSRAANGTSKRRRRRPCLLRSLRLRLLGVNCAGSISQLSCGRAWTVCSLDTRGPGPLSCSRRQQGLVAVHPCHVLFAPPTGQHLPHCRGSPGPGLSARAVVTCLDGTFSVCHDACHLVPEGRSAIMPSRQAVHPPCFAVAWPPVQACILAIPTAVQPKSNAWPSETSGTTSQPSP
jgi:hypothetical protein